ncbi:uncharacterized protein EV420DRAFT_1261524 [Desarmillaria tabescens]|uniref:BTB domain-containing protein n=1 Tax=Armillaria tabescens TaxID=1929756 RepID=A0AA39TTK0_ARMTA|nr:uncharacterized protein EV420DRAFT_1261524 [Desarmillaria tabescens]KAK0466003.1 hypothetical protein EV420DRAFT_1261524 [Desarmillaria tabescens]
MTTKPTTTTADSPFNDPTDCVDLVIRTSDNVDFFVLSGLLSLKSPSSFFRHVLKNSQHTDEKDGFPVLQVEEDSDTFRTILLFCYPNVAPQIKSIDQIVGVKKALDKYCMDHAMEQFIQTVTASPVMKAQALQIFALAVVNGWKVLGEVAAKSTLASPLSDPEAELEDLNYINAMQYVRLRNYHRKCRQAAQDVLSSSSAAPWLEGKESELQFLENRKCRWCDRTSSNVWLSPPEWIVHSWVEDYLAAVKAELR